MKLPGQMMSDITTTRGTFKKYDDAIDLSINTLPSKAAVVYEQENGNVLLSQDSGTVQWQHPAEEKAVPSTACDLKPSEEQIGKSFRLFHNQLRHAGTYSL